MRRRLGPILMLLAGGCRLLEEPKDDPTLFVPPVSREASSVPSRAVDDAEVNPRLLRRFKAISRVKGDPDPKVDLGARLFRDPRLSSDGTVACTSCHDLRRYGADDVPLSKGVDGSLGKRNAPTVLNATKSFAQFWDGRAATLEEQARGPILNPLEMGGSEAAIAGMLERATEYDAAFAGAFPGEVATKDLDHVARAIAAFEGTLVTPGRWDAFLAGDANALSRPEKKGLKIFINSGCMVCHTGVNLGGASFERAGVVEPWPNGGDLGRMEVTGASVDRMMFKVPTLRNVSRTAPYFHDGSASTLSDAVRMMGRHQLGLELGADEVDAITTWLDALTGELPEAAR